MLKKKNELEYESDIVKVYVQQIQAINGLLTTENDELKAELKRTITKNAENYHNSCLLQREINKNKQVFEEIKKLALQILDDDNNHCPFELTKEILNKIEELKIEEY